MRYLILLAVMVLSYIVGDFFFDFVVDPLGLGPRPIMAAATVMIFEVLGTGLAAYKLGIK